MKPFKRILLFLPLLSSCMNIDIEGFEKAKQQLLVEDYFVGKTWAWGIFEDRFGRLRREFTVEITGEWDGQTLVLDEQFYYSDGEEERRVWTIQRTGGNQYTGTADDVLGQAYGESVGNAVNWRYVLSLPVGDKRWSVKMDDWMYLQPNDTLINRATMSKYGIKLGTVTLFFSKQAPQ